jgi:hypothetical protein
MYTDVAYCARIEQPLGVECAVRLDVAPVRRRDVAQAEVAICRGVVVGIIYLAEPDPGFEFAVKTRACTRTQRPARSQPCQKKWITCIATEASISFYFSHERKRTPDVSLGKELNSNSKHECSITEYCITTFLNIACMVADWRRWCLEGGDDLHVQSYIYPNNLFVYCHVPVVYQRT